MTENKWPNSLREEIERAIEVGDPWSALVALRAFWQTDSRQSTANFVLSRFEKIRPALPVVRCRLAILRSFTVEPIIPLLRASAAVNGIDLTVHIGGFNAYAQEILDPNSKLYEFEPDIVILAIQSRDIAPDLWNNFPRMAQEQICDAIDRVVSDYRGWIEACRSRMSSHIIVHTLEAPFRASNGILDSQQPDGQVAAFTRINRSLSQLPTAFHGVYLLHYDELVAQNGRRFWHDEQNWVTARLPISASHLRCLASEWLRFLHPLTGKICKVLAVDLDNTLWGGVLGEDGTVGIQLGNEYPGVAFRNLQRAILDLSQRGIVLAVCSKNDAAEAEEVLENHPEMLLHPRDFATMRINWNDKAQNLREIAEELNIGIDSIAFLDDNPVERDWVRRQLPEITIVDLPQDPMDYEAALRESPVFERLAVSKEDIERGRHYGDQRLRSDLKRSTSSLEEFYYSLQTQVEIAPVGPRTLTRVAQLTQKTNQFNLTTKRRNEQQILDLISQRSFHVYSVTVRDRFGDNGIVGVVITREIGTHHEIDTFLLSCRVLGRTIETAVLSFLLNRAKLECATSLSGEFLSTKKNAPAREFYPSHGFRLIAEQQDISHWEYDLSKDTISEAPPWIQITISGDGST